MRQQQKLVLSGDNLLGEQVRGDFAEVPHDAEPGENLQRVVGYVNFPPEEALARRSHEVVMIVVPAFAEREQRQQPVVLAGGTGFVAARTEKMRERIDGEGVMPQQYRAQAEAPDEQRPSADQPQHHAERDGRNYMLSVHPAKLEKLGKVSDIFGARVVVFIRDDPADMGPEESEKSGRMQIQFLVRMPVMMAVMRRPPEHALLRRGHGHERDHKLKHAAGLKRAVRKITVVTRGDEEHPHDQQCEASYQVIPVKRHEEDQQRGDVNERKGQRKNKGNAGAIRKRY